VWSPAVWAKLTAAVAAGELVEPTDYPGAQQDITAALLEFGQKKQALVVGSVSPWVEAILHAQGYQPCTLDINPPIDEAGCSVSLTYDDTKSRSWKFNTIVSFSTTEHIGLGRYGDELDPLGDVKWMRWAKSVLAPEGVLLLAVPLATTGTIEKNYHRIYGPTTYQKLTAGWDVVAAFRHGRRTRQPLWRSPRQTGLPAWQHQPLVVLRPSQGTK